MYWPSVKVGFATFQCIKMSKTKFYRMNTWWIKTLCLINWLHAGIFFYSVWKWKRTYSVSHWKASSMLECKYKNEKKVSVKDSRCWTRQRMYRGQRSEDSILMAWRKKLSLSLCSIFGYEQSGWEECVCLSFFSVVLQGAFQY